MMLEYCCDTAADGGVCICELERQTKALPEGWELIRLVPLQTCTWLAAKRMGGTVSLFVVIWHNEGNVWHVEDTIVDLCATDLQALKNMLAD